MQNVRKLPPVLILVLGFIIIGSCDKNDETLLETGDPEVGFPGLELRHGTYYHLDHDSRSIGLLFDEEIDPSGVQGNIRLYDKNNSLDGHYDLSISGRLVMLMLHPEVSFRDGWKYTLEIDPALKMVSGNHFSALKSFDLRTRARHFFDRQKKKRTDRNALVCISDIHMGDSRANTQNYSWFGKNQAALENFLDSVYNHPGIRTVVILGDLFDEWVVPCEVSPFDEAEGITDSKAYFNAIADADVNAGIISRLQLIATHPEISLVYVPGNHDMLITEDILSEIIPGIIWAGDVTGLGIYHPVDDMVMEHGHRYDFFNTPQPLVNQGHMLPPGYFISRLYAQGMISGSSGAGKNQPDYNGSFEFDAAWTIAFYYVIHQFNMPEPPLNTPYIKMGGIDAYQPDFSFDEVYNMYAANIEDVWPQTQNLNQVPVPISVFLAIMNGHFLTNAVIEEYIVQSPGMDEKKVIVFGHSHDPLIDVFPAGETYDQIYANTGSWIDQDQCDNPVRTFVVVKPAQWTGSEIDCVQLYQYNPQGNAGKSAGYEAILLAEENVEDGE